MEDCKTFVDDFCEYIGNDIKISDEFREFLLTSYRDFCISDHIKDYKNFCLHIVSKLLKQQIPTYEMHTGKSEFIPLLQNVWKDYFDENFYQ